MRGEVRPAVRALVVLAALATLSACGPPTPEDLAREGLLRVRAIAVQRAVGICRAACDSSLARLDSGLPVEQAAVGQARAVCAQAGIR